MKSDQIAFSELNLFSHVLIKHKMQITSTICDFELLLLTSRSHSNEHPKSQILVVFVAVLVHCFTPPPEGVESNDDRTTHQPESRYQLGVA